MQLQFINRKGLSHSGFPENGTKFSRALNFSCANGTLHWRMFSFQSSFEENEICIICRATCFKHKATKELKIKNLDFRSSYQKCSVEKKIVNVTRKQLCRSLFLINFQTFSALQHSSYHNFIFFFHFT